MLFYYRNYSNLLVSDVCCCCCRRGFACRYDCPCFPVKNSFIDVIMNEHLKLTRVNGDTVWRGMSSGEGTKPGAQNRQKLPILEPKILSLKHPNF